MRALLPSLALLAVVLHGEALTAQARPIEPLPERIMGTGCSPYLVMLVGQRVTCRPHAITCEARPCRTMPVHDPASITWRSDDSTVASIDGGVIRARSAGQASVVVSSDDMQGTTLVTVLASFSDVRFERREYRLRVGDTVQILAWAYDENNSPVHRLTFSYFRFTGAAPVLRPPRNPDAPLPREPILAVATQAGRSRVTVQIADRADTAVVIVER